MTGHTPGKHAAPDRASLLSIATGPLRFALPAVGFAATYPVVLRFAGLETLGLWSVLGAALSLLTSLDFGFPQALSRATGRSASVGELAGLAIAARTVKRAYRILALSATALLLLVELCWLAPSPPGILVATVLLGGAAYVQLSARVDSALLEGLHDNAAVNIANAVAPFLGYGPMLLGVLSGWPLVGFGLGALVVGLGLAAFVRRRLGHHTARWEPQMETSGLVHEPPSFSDLRRAAGPLFAVSLGSMMRPSLAKIFVSATLGMEAAGLFELALRITQAARDTVATGSQALLPAFSALAREQNSAAIERLASHCSCVFVLWGSGVLGGLYLWCEPLLGLWLGTVPDLLVPTIRVLLIWQGHTLLNVPFWWFLLATSNERAAAAAVWSHTLTFVLGAVVAATRGYDLVLVAWLWLLSAIPTQLLIFVAVDRRLLRIPAVLFNAHSLACGASASVFLAAAVTASTSGLSPLPLTAGTVALASFSAALLVAGAAELRWGWTWEGTSRPAPKLP